MKLKITVVALAFAAGILASIAIAKPPPGRGQGAAASSSPGSTGSTTGAAPSASCRPRISIVLKGSFAGAGPDGASFAMDVRRSSRDGRALAGKQVSIGVDARTRFRRDGRAELADFAVGDRLNVQAAACKTRVAQGKGKGNGRHGLAAAAADQPALVARRVVGHPSADSGDGDSTTGSTSTSVSTETATTAATTATTP